LHFIGSAREDVDVVPTPSQSLQCTDHQYIRQVFMAFGVESTPALIARQLRMLLFIQPVAAMIDQRDRAIEVGDYYSRGFHFARSILISSLNPFARRKPFSSKACPTLGTAIANIAFEKSDNKNEFS
jgi:hypothetical protein